MRELTLTLLSCFLCIVALTVQGNAERDVGRRPKTQQPPTASGSITSSQSNNNAVSVPNAQRHEQTAAAASPSPSPLIGIGPESPPRVTSANSPQTEITSVGTKQTVVLPSKKFSLSADLSQTVYHLPAIDLANLPRKPNQVGVTRETDFFMKSVAKVFKTSASSEVLIVSVKSPEARAVRVHIRDFDIPEGDEVYIYGSAPDSEVQGPYTRQGPWKNKEFWSGTVEGDTAVIEYYSKSGGGGDFRIAEVSHIYQSIGGIISPVLSCEVDASCFSDNEKNAVGRIIYEDGGSFVCSGTLLNDKDTSSFIPYFITANHCVSTQNVAQTVEAYWFYQTTACDSGVLKSGIVHSISGSTMLATSQNADSTLIRMLGSMPGGLWFSGWDAGAKANGTSVFGFHHPGNGTPPSTESYLRRSDGSIVSTSATCSASGLTNGYKVDWNSGLTERGSSGSGLWHTNQGNKYLVGVLSCGPNNLDCNYNGFTFGLYGKFSDFFPLIQSYINTSSSGPANNDFASAQVISGNSGTTNGTNSGATKESGEPNHGGSGGGTSVWYRWQSPSSGSVTMTTSGSSFDTLLGVYTGTSVSGLTTIAGNDDDPNGGLTSRVTFNAIAGTNYRIAVDGFNAAAGNIVLNWNLTAQTYTIGVSASPSGGGAVSGSGTFPAGSSRTVTATANAGFTFLNWTENGTQVSTSASYNFILNASRTLVANFSCRAPGALSQTSPAHGQSFSSATTSVTLSWGTSANATSYDVYFGTSSNPPFLANQTGTSRAVNVTPGQTYYWKIVARVSCNSSLTATTTIRSFSVQGCLAPGAFTQSLPSNGQSFIPGTTSVPLSWGASANATSYDVYFGTSSNPPFLANQTGTSRTVSVTPGQTYYWKIVARVSCNSSLTATTTIRSFSVQSCLAPGAFTQISPSNGQSFTVGTTSVILSWTTSANANSYDVYFGTSSNPPLLANQASTSRIVSVTSGQTYYWKIVARVSCNSSLTVTTTIRSFSVQGCLAPGAFTQISPSNGQSFTSATTSVILSWTTSANANSYDVYFGTSSNPPLLANQASTSRIVSVTSGQTYYWKIVARVSCNSSLTATTTIRSFSVSCLAPGAFTQISPSNGQSFTSATTSVILSWTTSANANSYDVYFGTSSNPPFLANQASTSRIVSVTSGQTYYWKIVARVGCNSALTSTTTIRSFSVAQSSFQLVLEQFGPVPNLAAAIDAFLLLRDPFPVINGAVVLNQTSDKNTRVVIFLSNFQLGPGETAASVVVNLIGSNNQGFDVVAEDVRPLANSPFTQVRFKLPSGLAVGTCSIRVTARGQVSNSAVIRIRA